MGGALSSSLGKRKQHRIEQWRAHSTGRGVFAIALTAGDGARHHHRNWWDFLSARHVLLINQALTLFFAVALSVLSLFISIQLNKEEVVEQNEEESDTLGVEFSAMAALGLLIALSMAQGITATVNLHLGHLGIFLFLVLLIIPVLLLFALVMTDLQFVFKSYLVHHWHSKSLHFLRKEACKRSPRGRCKTPRLPPDDFDSIEGWCRHKFQETDCQQLRSSGIRHAWRIVRATAAFLAVLAWTEAAMLFWCVRLVCVIVTIPIVMQSAMRFYINVLAPMAVGVTFIGWQFQHHDAVKVEENVDEIGNLFFSTGVVMLAAILLGRCAAHVRSAVGMLTFIIFVVAVIVLCAVIAAFALTLFIELPNKLKNRDLDEIACKIHLYGCEGCDEDPPRCREWLTGEIVKYAQAYVKFAGFLAIVSIPPWLVALYVAYSLYKNYRDYESAYV